MTSHPPSAGSCPPLPWSGDDVDLDLGLAASFLVLAEERHYGKAAARLNITSPALTKRVQRLERQLDVVVLRRGPSGVADLTPAGARFAEAVGPLLEHAQAARSAARGALPHDPARGVVRFGIPAGSGDPLRQLPLGAVGRELRREHPGIALRVVDVDFADMTRCLPDGQVDVLWTDSPVLHAAVESVRLRLSSRRVGVVGVRHPLAEAGVVDAAEFVDERILYNPAVPEEWMKPFWLGDVRSRRQARLMPIDARDQAAVLMATTRLGAASVALEVSAGWLGTALRPVVLRDVPPVVFYAARRRTESRGAVLAVINALLALGPCNLPVPVRNRSFPHSRRDVRL